MALGVPRTQMRPQSCKASNDFHLLKQIFVFLSPVGFKGNLSLLEIVLYFSRGLNQMEDDTVDGCEIHFAPPFRNPGRMIPPVNTNKHGVSGELFPGLVTRKI